MIENVELTGLEELYDATYINKDGKRFTIQYTYIEYTNDKIGSFDLVTVMFDDEEIPFKGTDLEKEILKDLTGEK